MLQSMRSAAKYIWIFMAVCFVGGFLLYQTAGLGGRGPATQSTVVATVNGHDIPYLAWANATQRLEQQRTEQIGRSVTLDERDQIGDRAFDEMVGEILLQDEYKRRGITISDEDIIEAAQYSPPSELMQSPELQTEGRFDPEKYQRFLRSPAARQGGLLLTLEQLYRQELPKQRLFEQITSGVYVTDARLWRAWRDAHDSAQISYVAAGAQSIPDSAVAVSDAEIRAYYDQHKKELERRGRAVVSLLTLPRVVSAADSAAVRARILALRAEIAGGAKFEDVAKRESADSGSRMQGGALPRGGRGRFVPAFESVAYALKAGELSQPVLTPFGYHLIRVDERKGDTIAARHILLRIQQSDSAAARTDREADRLAKLAGSADRPARFDSAARALGLTPVRLVATEGEPLTSRGQYVPSVSAWAFGGARVGESSELIDSDDGYYLARLDSLRPGGVPELQSARIEIRASLARRKKVEQAVGPAGSLAGAAVASTLEQAAKERGLTVVKTPMFTRQTGVPGLGQFNEVVGAAFALPPGTVSAPITGEADVYVIRVDRRVMADSAAWVAQKAQQRAAALPALREVRIREYLQGLRASAKIVDHRKEILAATRRATT